MTEGFRKYNEKVERIIKQYKLPLADVIILLEARWQQLKTWLDSRREPTDLEAIDDILDKIKELEQT